MKKALLYFCLLMCCLGLKAQQNQPDETDVQEMIENNAQQNETENFEFDGNIDELE